MSNPGGNDTNLADYATQDIYSPLAWPATTPLPEVISTKVTSIDPEVVSLYRNAPRLYLWSIALSRL